MAPKNNSEPLIISARLILPISSAPLEDSSVLIAGQKIREIGSKVDLAAAYPDVATKELGNSVLMPGLVNAHAHLEISALRGYLDRFDDNFPLWLLNLVEARDRILDDCDLRISALLGAYEALEAGITFIADIGRHGFAGFEAMKKVGLRGIEFQETEFSPDSKTAEKDFGKLFEKFSVLREAETTRVKAGMSPHSPYSVSPELFKLIADAAEKENFKLTIHTAESAMETELLADGTGFFADVFLREGIDWLPPRCSAVEYLDSLGVISRKPLLAHCVTVSEADIEIIAARGASIAHCPRSNARLLHGIAPFAKFLDKGINVGLGSDSVASNNLCDLLDEARFASLASRISNGKMTNSFDLLFAATLGGAAALGIENEIGSIEEGKYADLIAISMDALSFQPVYNIFDSILNSARASDVIFSMVDGEILYNEGEFDKFNREELEIGLNRIKDKLGKI